MLCNADKKIRYLGHLEKIQFDQKFKCQITSLLVKLHQAIYQAGLKSMPVYDRQLSHPALGQEKEMGGRSQP